ncbi:hypothetical protein KY290_023028 [Solanum tuberosum]|uniref:Uncharacterized protein n=1 Tax=Solanum tuberosum TaxID=4113 RepID=A0ABQ7V964_SOLTU|nr:hypothetical protein KY285_021804 [Solanum tuberosum]KAH0759535.1 hypothetical protein KY290_023028 [Solanum tuberosum]
MLAHAQPAHIQIRPKFLSEIPKLIFLTQTTVKLSTLVSDLRRSSSLNSHLSARRPSSLKPLASRCSWLLAECSRLAARNCSVLATRKSKVGAHWPVATAHRVLSINFI